jgi:exopolyphosphatase/guanosine-5'-triphosphate,3'-diphosphate pyrophosphatase
MTRRVATVDMGTNTLKFSVTEVNADGSQEIVDAHAETVRLGYGIGETGQIDPQRASMALAALASYEQRAAALGALDFIGVATAALRIASNGESLLEQISQQTRWKVHVISGDEEARLTFEGLRSDLPARGTVLLIDIGGGSTEAILIQDREKVAEESNHIGSGVLADAVFTASPPGEAQVHLAVDRARAILAESQVIGPVPDGFVVLSGGNGQFLKALSEWEEIAIPFTPDAFEELMNRVAGLDPETMASYLGIVVERARMIPAGAAIARAVLELASPMGIGALPSGIRGGLVSEWEAGLR